MPIPTTPTPPSSSSITPFFHPSPITPESPAIQSLITQLTLHPHPEGGYYAETDRSLFRVPNPFLPSEKARPEEYCVCDGRHNTTLSTAAASGASNKTATGGGEGEGGAAGADDDATRSASTTIFYLLTPSRPTVVFHSNKARTVHTLHKGRGRYVIIHPPTEEVSGTGKGHARLETFVVGPDVAKGEKLQWIVEGGRWKASFLLPDEEGDGAWGSRDGLLISETVVPGFEFRDHDFLLQAGLETLFGVEKACDLGWLLRRGLEN